MEYLLWILAVVAVTAVLGWVKKRLRRCIMHPWRTVSSGNILLGEAAEAASLRFLYKKLKIF